MVAGFSEQFEVFPAYAGMILADGVQEATGLSVPRIRGDDPGRNPP